MESYGIEEARNKLGPLVERIRNSGEHIALTWYGKPTAILVPVGWHEKCRELREEENV